MSDPIRIAAMMDPIGGIKPSKDSTFGMLLAAQSRGWQTWVGGLQDIWVRDGEAFGRLTEVELTDDSQRWYRAGAVEETALGDVDVILMRKDPPFDMEYVQATYILERAEEAGSVVVNRPRSLRDANEKTFVSWFPQCCPPTLITRSLADLRAFIDEHGRAVVKPLDGMAGWGVFATGSNDGNRNVILELLTSNGSTFVMAQRYVDAISETGDKRILLIDGEPIPFALARFPSGGDHRGNLVCGARGEVRPLTDRDRWICEQIGPTFRERGIIFAGIDVIGDYMTEINITSPTGIRELEREHGLSVAHDLMDAIASRLRPPAPRPTATTKHEQEEN